MKTKFKSADLKKSILSNVRRCWLAMPPVPGFLEMFAGVPYNVGKKRMSSPADSYVIAFVSEEVSADGISYSYNLIMFAVLTLVDIIE